MHVSYLCSGCLRMGLWTAIGRVTDMARGTLCRPDKQKEANENCVFL